jgi:hypothetical protein
MSAAGEATDAHASRAKPRLEERGCEHGWHPTLDAATRAVLPRRAPRRARRRAIAQEADAQHMDARCRSKEAEE